MRKETKLQGEKKIKEIEKLKLNKEVPDVWEGIRFKRYSMFSVKEYISGDKFRLVGMNEFYIYLKNLSLKDVEIIDILEPYINLEDEDENRKTISIRIQRYVNDLLTVNGLSKYSLFDIFPDCIDTELKHCVDTEMVQELYQEIKLYVTTFIKEMQVMGR